MMTVIFLGGVFRSLQFTALNTIAFAEIEGPLMSQATSFSQMAQRLSLSFGVAISACVRASSVASRVAAPFSTSACRRSAMACF